MIALGGAIGTGLFLGSAVSRQPGWSWRDSELWRAAALIALALMWALAEMTVVHPVAGSFGVFAEIYLHPWAGFAVRYSYWLATGGCDRQRTCGCCRFIAATGIRDIPAWIWITLFSSALVYINARSVGNFGTFEYWFALIKVVDYFCVSSSSARRFLLELAFTRSERIITRRSADFCRTDGQALGWAWRSRFSAISDSKWCLWRRARQATREVAVPRATRWTLARLALFYIGGMAVLVGVMPWTQAGLAESPFVRVFQSTGIPYAAALMNFVVLTAALSSVNTDLYLTTRMLFSLSRGGYAPAFLGRLNAAGRAARCAAGVERWHDHRADS